MPAKSRFTKLDAFTKTVEDARVRTTSGGIVTLASVLIILYLVFTEWADYKRVVIRPEVVVDKGRGERMEIHLNVSFPRVPCQLLTLDVMDVSGEVQSGIMHGVTKVRLRSKAEGGGEIERERLDLHSADDVARHMDPSYCGPCYGADSPENAMKPGCCNTCKEVQDAYASKSWAFGDGKGMEQCEKEHYSEKLEEQRSEGCRIEGALRVNKVVGNFHIAPGRSFSNGPMHVHDLNTYYGSPIEGGHTFTHEIHQLRFGPQIPDSIINRVTDLRSVPWTNHHTNPLDNTKQETNDPAYNYMYFVKVVSTSYLPLGMKAMPEKMAKLVNRMKDSDMLPLGEHGLNKDGSLETHQYSVTSHKRSLAGGTDASEGHAERMHAKGGIPGVFVSYDISPMKVINREERSKSFLGFLTGVFAVIGGTLTVAAAIDRGMYEGVSRFKKMKHKE